jgi:RHS repeat-associated protein
MDGHSGVRGLTNSSGSLTDSYAYGAFGDLKNSTGTTANNYRYTGQQFDSLTGLYSLRARYYNPGEGRFLSKDTWEIDQYNPIEYNRYGYVANNPIRFNDPSGYFGGLSLIENLVLLPTVVAVGYFGLGTLAMLAVNGVLLGGMKESTWDEIKADKSVTHKICTSDGSNKTCTLIFSDNASKSILNLGAAGAAVIGTWVSGGNPAIAAVVTAGLIFLIDQIKDLNFGYRVRLDINVFPPWAIPSIYA